jgi:hypothetical protein
MISIACFRNACTNAPAEAGTSGSGSLTARGRLAKSKIHTSSNPLPLALNHGRKGPVSAHLTA